KHQVVEQHLSRGPGGGQRLGVTTDVKKVSHTESRRTATRAEHADFHLPLLLIERDRRNKKHPGRSAKRDSRQEQANSADGDTRGAMKSCHLVTSSHSLIAVARSSGHPSTRRGARGVVRSVTPSGMPQ